MPSDIYSKVHFHFPFYHKDHGIHLSENSALYLTHAIRVMAVSLVGIFLPIYIYNISESFLFFSGNIVINGISWVLVYYLLRSTFVWISLLLFGETIFSKFHFQLSMIVSFVILIVEIMLWYLSKDNLFLILLAGSLAGFKVTFYWIPFHVFFLRKVGKFKKHFAKNTSLRFFLTRLFSGLGPAIGGIIIVWYGFGVLFSISIILLVVAALPITFVIHDWKHKKHSTLKVLKNYLLNSKMKNLSLSYFGQGFEFAIYATFWPILLFFVLQNFASIGFVNTLSFLISSITVLFIGKMIDKHGTKKIHAIGTLVNAVLYLPRIFFSSPTLFYGLNIMDRFVSGAISLPLMSLSYEKAKKLGGSDYFMYRELTVHAGVVIMAVSVLIALQVFTYWKWVFILAMVASLLTYLIEVDEN